MSLETKSSEAASRTANPMLSGATPPFDFEGKSLIEQELEKRIAENSSKSQVFLQEKNNYAAEGYLERAIALEDFSLFDPLKVNSFGTYSDDVW